METGGRAIREIDRGGRKVERTLAIRQITFEEIVKLRAERTRLAKPRDAGCICASCWRSRRSVRAEAACLRAGRGVCGRPERLQRTEAGNAQE